MRKSKYAFCWRFVMLFTAIVIIGFELGRMREVYASDNRKDALKAYKQMLSAKTIVLSGQTFKAKNIYFNLGYLDNNDVPEMLLAIDKMAPYAIYTYYNGKIYLVAKKNGLWPFSALYKTGVYFTSIYSDGFSPGSVFYIYNKGKSRKLFRYKRVYENWPDDGEGDYYYKYAFYDSNDKRISFSEFSSLFEKYTKQQFPSIFGETKAKAQAFRAAYEKQVGKSAFSYRYHRNTKKNREKYLR